MVDKPLPVDIVQSLLADKGDEPLFASLVTVKKDKRKSPSRIFVIGHWHVYFLSPSAKHIKRQGHLKGLLEIHSETPQAMTLEHRDWKVYFLGPRVDEAIQLMCRQWMKAFHAAPPCERFRVVVPAAREPNMRAPSKQTAGGFSATFKALSSLHGIQPRVDVLWDVRHIFVDQDLHTFDPLEFEQPIEPLELSAMFQTLRYNTYFNEIVVADMKLDKDRTIALFDVFSGNTSVRSLSVSDCGSHINEQLPVLAAALESNENHHLTSISMSKNDALAKAFHGFVSLDFSHNHLSGKRAITQLGSALRDNAHMASSLAVLNLSGNRLLNDGASALSSFLATPNVLEQLLLCNCFINIDTIAAGLIRGSHKIEVLDVSHNKLGKHHGSELVRYVGSCVHLRRISLASTGLQPPKLREILKSLFDNVNLEGIDVDVSGNALGALGANLLGTMVGEAKTLTSLNVSNAEFGDHGLQVLLDGFARSCHLRHLDISDNYKGKGRGVVVPKSLESLSNWLCGDSPSTTLTSLTLTSSSKSHQFKGDLVHFLSDLVNNDTLTSLDITGHAMEFKGGVALGKLLQVNHTLCKLRWDGNQTPFWGVNAFVQGLQRNPSLVDASLPLQDVTALLHKSDTAQRDRLLALMDRMQSLLLRNAVPSVGRLNGDMVMSSSSTSSTAHGHTLAHDQRRRAASLVAPMDPFAVSAEGEQLHGIVGEITSSCGQRLTPEQHQVLADAQQHESHLAALECVHDACLDGVGEAIQGELSTYLESGALDAIIEAAVARVCDQLVERASACARSIDTHAFATSLRDTLADVCVSPQREHMQRCVVDNTAEEVMAHVSMTFARVASVTAHHLYTAVRDRLMDVRAQVSRLSPLPSPRRPPSARGEHHHHHHHHHQHDVVEGKHDRDDNVDDGDHDGDDGVVASEPPPRPFVGGRVGGSHAVPHHHRSKPPEQPPRSSSSPNAMTASASMLAKVPSSLMKQAIRSPVRKNVLKKSSSPRKHRSGGRKALPKAPLQPGWNGGKPHGPAPTPTRRFGSAEVKKSHPMPSFEPEPESDSTSVKSRAANMPMIMGMAPPPMNIAGLGSPGAPARASLAKETGGSWSDRIKAKPKREGRRAPARRPRRRPQGPTLRGVPAGFVAPTSDD